MSNKPDTINEETTAANSVELVDERSLKEKIYIIRGVQVMLDFELAEIYGYTTGKMNERVKDNAERFEGEEFRFQLTKDEYNNLKSEKRISSWGGRRTLPYAFTEQGIYMLMTILKGDLAVKQSRKLVRKFLGEDFKSVIVRRRMELAMIYLANPEKSLEEIAWQVGYRSYSGFQLCFKRYFGVSPSEKRRELLENREEQSC